jgi:hypothetical protein
MALNGQYEHANRLRHQCRLSACRKAVAENGNNGNKAALVHKHNIAQNIIGKKKPADMRAKKIPERIA